MWISWNLRLVWAQHATSTIVPLFVKLLEACIGVGLERTLVELQMQPWVLSLAVGRVGEPDGGCGRIARWPVVADISPEPSGLGPAVAWREHRDRRVVGVQLARGHDMIANSFNQRSQKFAGCAHPSSECRAIQVDAFASIDLRLPVERLMIGILRYQYMCEQTRSREPTIDRPRWCRCLHDPVAGIAAQLGPHMTENLEAGPYVLQYLSHVFAQVAQTAAAVGAGLMGWPMRMDFAWKMLGQGAAEGLRGRWTLCGRNRLRLLDGTGGLQVFKLELELFDLAEDLFALRSEEHPLQLLDQQHQAVDLTGSRAERRGVPLMLRNQQRLSSFKIEAIEVRKRGAQHERSMP